MDSREHFCTQFIVGSMVTWPDCSEWYRVDHIGIKKFVCSNSDEELSFRFGEKVWESRTFLDERFMTSMLSLWVYKHKNSEKWTIHSTLSKYDPFQARDKNDVEFKKIKILPDGYLGIEAENGQ